MRALTPTLLAAQRALGGVPSVRLRIEDHELRWTALVDDDSSARQTACCAAGARVVRARIGAAGTLDVQVIASPLEPAQWQAWTTLVTGVAPESDVAISAMDGDPAKVRAFFVRTGGGAYRISWVQSADGGLTWSSPEDLLSELAVAGRGLASANAQLFFHGEGDDHLRLALREGWDAAAWAIHSWAASGALAIRHGLAAGYAPGTYYLATCDQEADGLARLRTGAYTVATDSWTDPVPVVPPGLAAPSFVPMYPSLAFAAGLWHLAYLETFSGLLVYAEPTVIHSPDWEHWSFAAWVPLEAFEPQRRATLSVHDQALYLAMENTAWRASLYDPEDPDQSMMASDVKGYVVEEEPWSGRALVELANPSGRYAQFGQPGCVGAPIRPLATVIVERGYRTAVGEERMARPPYYIVSAAIQRGGPRPGLYLECEDGWGLLERWQPDALYAWAGKTVGWLVAEVLYRATGLGCVTDGAQSWDTVLETFALAPSNWSEAIGERRRAWLARELRPGRRRASLEVLRSTGLGALRTLLAKVSGDARWQPDGTLYCFIPWAQEVGEPYTVGAGAEIIDGLYGRGLVLPTQARTFGDGVAGTAATFAGGVGRRYVATCADPHLRTSAQCAARASGLAARGQAGAYLGWVETPCQCGLELFDPIAVDDAQAGALAGVTLRAAAIVERYSPAEGVFVTRTTIEGV